MKFIYCFDEKLKDKLIKNGYDLLSNGNGFFIFSNNLQKQFNFEKVDKTKYMYSDKIVF